MAKKRYHQSLKDRMDESRAMRYENHSSGMISEDKNAPCLLPQHVIEKYYPAGHMYGMNMVDDLFDGVQKQLHEDARDFKRALSPKKY